MSNDGGSRRVSALGSGPSRNPGRAAGPAVLGLLALTALTLPAPLWDRPPRAIRLAVGTLPTPVVIVLTVALCALAVAALILLRIPPAAAGRRRGGLARILLGLFVLALAATLPPIQRFVGTVLDRLDDGLGGLIGSPATGAPGARTPTEQPAELVGVLLGAAVALLAVVAVVAAARLRARPAVSGAPGTTSTSVLAAAERDLETIADPRAAVIACYARVRALAPGPESETPYEALHRMLDQHDVPPADLHRLTDLFERARFSTHAIGEGMRADALTALRRVQEQLG